MYSIFWTNIVLKIQQLNNLDSNNGKSESSG